MTSDDDPTLNEVAAPEQPTEKPANPYGGGYKGFKKGNPGKPPGARNKLMLLSTAMMMDKSKQIVQAVLDAATAGDMNAAKLVIDRIHPRPRDPVVKIELPECNSLQDFPAVTNAILDAVAEGEISPSEGNAIANGVLAADTDEAGHAFQSEAGHPYRSEAGHRSDLMSATGGLLPRIKVDDVSGDRIGQARIDFKSTNVAFAGFRR